MVHIDFPLYLCLSNIFLFHIKDTNICPNCVLTILNDLYWLDVHLPLLQDWPPKLLDITPRLHLSIINPRNSLICLAHQWIQWDYKARESSENGALSMSSHAYWKYAKNLKSYWQLLGMCTTEQPKINLSQCVFSYLSYCKTNFFFCPGNPLFCLTLWTV